MQVTFSRDDLRPLVDEVLNLALVRIEEMHLANERSKSTAGTEPLLLTSQQAAEALQVCEATLRNLRKRGELRVVQVANAVRYDRRDIEAWIQKAKGKADGHSDQKAPVRKKD